MKLRLWLKNLIVRLGFGDRLFEYCQQCGGDVPLTWRADAELYLRFAGAENTTFCPNCFDARAFDAGVLLTWEAYVEIDSPATFAKHKAQSAESAK